MEPGVWSSRLHVPLGSALPSESSLQAQIYVSVPLMQEAEAEDATSITYLVLHILSYANFGCKVRFCLKQMKTNNKT